MRLIFPGACVRTCGRFMGNFPVNKSCAEHLSERNHVGENVNINTGESCK